MPRFGDKAFELAAGFLRISGGREPLDNTGIHPESYGIVKAMAGMAGVPTKELPGNVELLRKFDATALADSGLGGRATIADIIEELKKPGRDPRVDNAATRFTPDIDSFEQLHAGMKVHGVVTNITAFGAFVDLGIKENGLLHISKISRKRIGAVSDVLHIGDQIEVYVSDVDAGRRRISLSMFLA